MNDLLLAAVRRRIRTKPTDLGNVSPIRLQPADPERVANDERQLGFSLPDLLKRLYTEIGNGGFGPGYGLIGLTGGAPDDTGKTSPTIYEELRHTDPEDPYWQWPAGLLPICHWGCAILSCVDCADPHFRMRIFDPNAHREGDWSDAFSEEFCGLDEWIGMWASGVDLWKRMYSESGPAARSPSVRDVDT
ncbi:SMI1/KNR4 family protein [Inquilinus sp. Marseille-Q2685]|uniref:SMI1/KNR4 family protein n=1 Tax=Inquilinus sp. Marseille-Q2685 TaxID=2866581 RepID=UPI001CE490A7|nr:SMI1/KNR4 family protein [Inquilinus sp. Marseille-Q2685]